MKISSDAFEAIYQACDPVKRKIIFRKIGEQKPPAGIYMLEVSIPMPAWMAMASESAYASIRLFLNREAGAWDLFQLGPQRPGLPPCMA